MSTVLRTHSVPKIKRGANWLGRALAFFAITTTGVIFGMQYYQPNKRVVAVMAGLLLLGVAWRLSMVLGIGVLVLALPFPRSTVFGSTNLAFVLLLLILWLLRASTGQASRPRATPLDPPIIGLLIAYILSFYNVTEPRFVQLGLERFFIVLACIAIYYLVVNNVRSDSDLKRLHNFQLVSISSAYGVAFWELILPGRDLIPGWIEFGNIVSEGAQVTNLRVGGPFFDYELFAEFTALSLWLLIFRLRQARSPGLRTLLYLMIVVSVFVLFTTVTRGAVFAFLAGAAYLGFLSRRRLKVVPVTILVVVSIAATLAMDWYVRTFTVSGSLVERMLGTKFEGGVPDSRVAVWPMAIERWLLHPIIGSGPYYSTEHGLLTWIWPHNVYLYILNIIGIVGLAFFVLLLVKLWQASRPSTDDLSDPRYADAYLLIGRVMLLTFIVDQTKIEYLRNSIYQFQVWLLFSGLIAASEIRRFREPPGTRPSTGARATWTR